MEVRIGKQGRLVIPAGLRRALGVQPGDRFLAREEEGRFILEKRERVRARVQERFAKVPSDVSLADELIAERRTEALRDGLP